MQVIFLRKVWSPVWVWISFRAAKKKVLFSLICVIITSLLWADFVVWQLTLKCEMSLLAWIFQLLKKQNQSAANTHSSAQTSHRLPLGEERGRSGLWICISAAVLLLTLLRLQTLKHRVLCLKDCFAFVERFLCSAILCVQFHFFSSYQCNL